MASDWNRLMEMLVASDLSATECRLALGIARLTLGWKTPRKGIGRDLLMAQAGIADRRTFERARESLVEKGVCAVEPGSAGKGNRTVYELLLNAAPERLLEEAQKAAPTRPKEKSPKGRSQTAQQAAPERLRRGIRQGKNIAAKTFQNRVVDAYVSTGGNLDFNPSWRGSLLSQATELAKKHPEDLILAAVKKLGRDREFPGYLKQRVKDLADLGGPCEWEGCDHWRLTAEQLTSCGCPRCEEWLPYAVGAA